MPRNSNSSNLSPLLSLKNLRFLEKTLISLNYLD
nr:MAG TPA: hypothetical protein [Caudoviricetes sp.]